MLTEQDIRKLWWIVGISCTWPEVGLTWLHTFFKIHQTVHLKLEHCAFYKLCCKFYFLNTQPAAHCPLGHRCVKTALVYWGPSRKRCTGLPGPRVVSYCQRGLAPNEAWTSGRHEVSSVLAPPWDPTTLSRERRVLPPKQEAQLVLGGGHQAPKEVKEKGRRVLRREDT